MVPDESLWSVRRLVAAIRMWLFWQTREPPVDVTLTRLLRYHRRPFASHRDGVY